MSHEPKHDPDERVSLSPLDAETALRALLAVKPEDEQVEEPTDPPAEGD